MGTGGQILNSYQNLIFGNELSNITFGINWYLNQYTKFQFNYIRSFVNNGMHGDANTDIMAFRAQLDF
jgi:phosphate-selective porin OprO/OprP